jgi:predicted CopG family antitoxin
MSRELTITLPDDVYEELKRRAGHDDISHYIERLVRPTGDADIDLEDGYRAKAADQDRERDARAWIEAETGDALPGGAETFTG